MSPIRATAVLLAAGLGTRYGGLKQLDPVGPGDTTLLDYALADAGRAGFADAVVVVRPEIEGEVARHLRRTGAGGIEWRLVRQTPRSALPDGAAVGPDRRKPWGTTHAVLVAAAVARDSFAVANADDHYGAGAWRCLGEWLDDGGDRGGDPARAPAADAAPRAALVGYRLADTLSGHGGVNRGVCVADERGRLERIAEATDVRREPDGVVRGTVEGARRALDEDARISMNLWGFGPGVAPLLEEAFRAFVEGGPGPDDELQLPEVVGRAVAAGRLSVELLPCGEGWFGMTWPEDRPDVVRRLARRGPPAGPPALDEDPSTRVDG